MLRLAVGASPCNDPRRAQLASMHSIVAQMAANNASFAADASSADGFHQPPLSPATMDSYVQMMAAMTKVMAGQSAAASSMFLGDGTASDPEGARALKQAVPALDAAATASMWQIMLQSAQAGTSSAAPQQAPAAVPTVSRPEAGEPVLRCSKLTCLISKSTCLTRGIGP